MRRPIPTLTEFQKSMRRFEQGQYPLEQTFVGDQISRMITVMFTTVHDEIAQRLFGNSECIVVCRMDVCASRVRNSKPHLSPAHPL
jgi:hypothetical protein